MSQPRRVVMGAQEVSDLDDDALPTESMIVNMGPSHPAMHGTVRIVVTLDGETIQHADVQVGYLHRCFEKESEHATYTQIFPYTDRLNYVSPMCNNVGFAMAVEKLLGIGKQIPDRAEYIRVIVSELSRISDHLTCNSASAMELGGFTPFLYGIKAREWIWEMLEELSGARLTYSYVRIGGVVKDLPAGWADRMRGLLPKVLETLIECERLLVRNRIFRDRMDDIGVISAADAIAWGWTGPCLRSTGVAYDVRKDHPYGVYDRLEFEVPVGSTGDNFDRFAVRAEEIRQSIRMVEQCLDQMQPGPIMAENPLVMIPPKPDTYETIEGMINHFKMIVDGIRVPPGETYSFSEAGNGELGFYIVADGSGRPFRCRVRPPCFAITQALSQLITGRMIPDVVPTFGMLNMIGGECDR